MDLAIDCKKSIRYSVEKRSKQRISSKKSILSPNNCIDDFYSDEEFVKPKEPTVKRLSEVSVEEQSETVISEKSLKSNNVIEDILHLLSKKLHLSENTDPIRDRYRQYIDLTSNQKDTTKTDYTYSHSFSYRRQLGLSKVFDWIVPNMSRKTISSSKSISSTLTSSTTSQSQSSNEMNIKKESSTTSSESSRSSRARTPSLSPMFTRSQCLGGSKCEAPDCEIHRKRKRGNKSGVVVPNSGPGLVPEFEFSDDDDYTVNNRLNQQRANNYQRNGYHPIDGTEESYEDEEEEEITYIRKVTNIFRTTINHTSRIINSVTPEPVRKVANKCPSLWLFSFIVLLSSLPLFYIYGNHSKSSLWSDHSIDSITGAISDISSREAFSQLAEELKTLRSELSSLKNSNEDLKLKFTDKEINSNDKLNHLSDKIDSIESYFNNYMKNCCKNETDTILALIDERLSAFMIQMLSDNQNNRQSITPSEAKEELKKFILSELSKTNEDFRKDVEEKLMLTIKRVEHRLTQSSEGSSSNVTIDEIKSLISQALAIYDADKTGQPDFALEPAGGTIVNTRCSETYDPYGVQYRIFGMPVWSNSLSPRAVIQPTISPGECWAFKGANGYLVIKLSQSITPTGFSYEHIPKQISRDGNINSAPKEFQVRGLEDESDTKGQLLGNYIYEDNDRPMQYFEVQDPNPSVFQLIELVILSNHGHNEYTCLYRFRVHGKRANH